MALTRQQLWIATKIDARMQKLVRAGKDNLAIMGAMADHMPAFHQLLTTAEPDDLDQLSRKFAGFHTYASLMEQAAEAEQRKPARAYDGLPELPDPLKERLSSLLSTATKLERDYQSVLDAAGTTAPTSWLRPIGTLHAQWQADLTRFRAAIQCAGVPQAAREVMLPVLQGMARRIAALEARIHTS